ncbi:hypothetical protein [Spiroplasma endosymbiont of Danaus chrysippus]|uniref:hypothetical protein n=1 Tax=Spiroplasma endosymbiont of Danaus chrysippus TaxID=2691041 RepID=UPI00157A789B|nr:hypothetical protein [Spiroplasma endosymbiont of Danaus chrysippus]
MQLTSKEQELLSTYQKWLKENNLSGNCNAYFISKTSMLVFQVWDLQEIISETIWLKTNNQEWQFYIKNLGEKFNKDFSLKEILKMEKDFVLKTFKEKQNL